VNALLAGILIYAGLVALVALVAALRHAQGKGFSMPAPVYTPIVYSGPTEPRDPALCAQLQELGFRPAISYRGGDPQLAQVFQTWLDEAGTTECLFSSFVRGAYETRILCFWSMLPDGSTSTTVGEPNLPIFEDMPSQRTTFVPGATDAREILAAHRARLAAETALKSIADHDLQRRADRTREYLDFQRSRGLLQLDAAKGRYVATPRFTLRVVRQQLLPVVADLRAKPLVAGLAIACLVPVSLLFFPARSVPVMVLDLVSLFAAGVAAGWMFGPRFLPWSLILAAVPLYFVTVADPWVCGLLPFGIAFVTYMRRLKAKRVVVNTAPPTNKLRNTILLWVVLLVLFVAFFFYFRQPPR